MRSAPSIAVGRSAHWGRSIFSFQTIKPLNTYGGGMAVVRDPALASAFVPRLLGASARRQRSQPEVVARPCAAHRDAAASLHVDDVSSCLCVPAPEQEFRRLLLGEIRPLSPLPPGYHVRYANVQAAIGLEGFHRAPRSLARRGAPSRGAHERDAASCPRRARPDRAARSDAHVLPGTAPTSRRATRLSIAAFATESISRLCTWTSARRSHSSRRLTCRRQVRR